MTTGFESVLISGIKTALKEEKDAEHVNALLKLLVEIRESAKMNEDFVSYERITDSLEELGITLREEVHVTAQIKAN